MVTGVKLVGLCKTYPVQHQCKLYCIELAFVAEWGRYAGRRRKGVGVFDGGTGGLRQQLHITDIPDTQRTPHRGQIKIASEAIRSFPTLYNHRPQLVRNAGPCGGSGDQ